MGGEKSVKGENELAGNPQTMRHRHTALDAKWPTGAAPRLRGGPPATGTCGSPHPREGRGVLGPHRGDTDPHYRAALTQGHHRSRRLALAVGSSTRTRTPDHRVDRLYRLHRYQQWYLATVCDGPYVPGTGTLPPTEALAILARHRQELGGALARRARLAALPAFLSPRLSSPLSCRPAVTQARALH